MRRVISDNDPFTASTSSTHTGGRLDAAEPPRCRVGVIGIPSCSYKGINYTDDESETFIRCIIGHYDNLISITYLHHDFTLKTTLAYTCSKWRACKREDYDRHGKSLEGAAANIKVKFNIPNGFIMDPPTLSPVLLRKFEAALRSMNAAVRSLDAIFFSQAISLYY
jgi:hypothetical protein